MSDTDEIIKELTGALTSNTEALSQLKMQVAKQGDTLAEVKRHSESVKNKVDWDNLGQHVFKGVASSTMGKIEETTGAAKALGRHADALSIASKDQAQAVKMLDLAAEKTADVRRQGAEAADRLHSAISEVSGACGYQNDPHAACRASHGLSGAIWRVLVGQGQYRKNVVP